MDRRRGGDVGVGRDDPNPATSRVSVRRRWHLSSWTETLAVAGLVVIVCGLLERWGQAPHAVVVAVLSIAAVVGTNWVPFTSLATANFDFVIIDNVSLTRGSPSRRAPLLRPRWAFWGPAT